jgi:hypothetical protein
VLRFVAERLRTADFVPPLLVGTRNFSNRAAGPVATNCASQL